MGFEFVETNPGSGGSKYLVDRITIGADTIEVIQNSIVVGSDGGPYVLVNSSNPFPVTLISSSITLPVSIAGAVTVDSELPTAILLADNLAVPTVPGVGAYLLVFDGSTFDRARGDSTDGLLVNLGTNNDITVTSGSVTISGTVTVDSELPAAILLTDNLAVPTVPGVGAYMLIFDGSAFDRAPGTSTDGLLVNLGANNDVTVTSGSITADTELPAAAVLADNTANPTVPGVGAFLLAFDGSTFDRVRGDSTDGLLVNLGANNDVTISGTASVSFSPKTSGGYSVARDIDLDEASPANIKASPGQVYGWYFYNNASSTRYIKLYDKATAPVLASDTPLMTIPMPAGAAANVFNLHGIPFTNGIGWAATTGVADNDTGAPAANDVIANLYYV